MSHRWVEHTAELELELAGATEEAVFAAALAALAELLSPDRPARAGEPVTLEIGVGGSDRALLLADWLDELVFRAETEGIVPQSVQRLELDQAGLSAVVGAVRREPRPLVKGVTHHRLRFERVDGGYLATLVLDV